MALGSSTSSDADRTKAIKIGVAVVLLAVAGVLIFMNLRGEPAGGTPLPAQAADNSNSAPTAPPPPPPNPKVDGVRKSGATTLSK